MSGWLRVAAKDLRVELRARETFLPVALTALLVVVAGSLALHDVHERAAVAAAILWTGLAFAASTGLARSFGAERDRGTLDTLLALPLDRSALYLGKSLASLATLLAVALLTMPLLVAAGAPVPEAWPALLLVVLLGCVGLAATGTMLSLLAAQARGRDLLLPVLLLPLAVPLLVASIHGSLDLLEGRPFAEWRPELLLLCGYDLAFVGVSALLAESALD